MEKSREAFRTISEVAEWLDVPTHVLRFWESRFSQIKPVKRAGGRRYYRPSDMRVIGGVKTLLHDQGMTIRGVQKLFREQGIKHVSSFSPEIYAVGEYDTEAETIEQTAVEFAPAGPASAARSTRDAAPAPVIDNVATAPVEPWEEEAVPEKSSDRSASSEAEAEHESPPETGTPALDEVVLFRRRSENDPIPALEPSSEEASKDVPALKPETLPEAAPHPVPTIPPTPGVPPTDPVDDDPEYAAEAGMSARLVSARRSTLRPHRETIAEVVRKLKDIRDRRA